MYNPCETPGMKIRSRGYGRGLARGGGYGPMGTPISAKGSGWAGNIYNPLGKPRYSYGRNPIARFRGLGNPARGVM